MYQQQKKVCEKRKSHKRVTILKQNKLIPKLMKIFFSFEKKKRNKKSKEHVGHFLTSSSNHSKFGYRVYSIKRMCDYFFFWWGKKDYCCCWCFGLELLYGNCKTWCSSRFQKLCTPPPPSPPEFIIHAVYPATINQKNRNREIRHHLISPTPPTSSSSSSSSCFLFSYLLAYAFYQQTLSRTTFPFGILAKKSNFKT